MRVIEFEIPETIPTLNAWQRTHWRMRQKQTQRIAWLCRLAIGPVHDPVRKCRVTVVRWAPRRADLDNLLVKPLLDALVVPTKRNPFGIGVIMDDGPDYVVELTRKQEKAPRNEQRTLVRIDEMA